MFKQVALLILLSVVAIMWQDQLAAILKGFFWVHEKIVDGLNMIFASSRVGEIVQSVLALLLIPVVVAVLLAIAHFFLRQMHFPHTMSVVWVIWAISVSAILAHTGHISNQVAAAAFAPAASSDQMEPADTDMTPPEKSEKSEKPTDKGVEKEVEKETSAAPTEGKDEASANAHPLAQQQHQDDGLAPVSDIS